MPTRPHAYDWLLIDGGKAQDVHMYRAHAAVFLYSRAPGQGEEGEARPGWRSLYIDQYISRMQVPKYIHTDAKLCGLEPTSTAGGLR